MEHEKLKELFKNTEEVILATKNNKIIVENMKERLLDQGVSRGEVQKIFNGQTNLEETNLKTVILFVKSLYEVTDGDYYKLYLENYLSKKEINEIINSKEMRFSNGEKKSPLVFKNVEFDGDSYTLKLSARDIVELYNSKFLKVNFEIGKRYKFSSDKSGKATKVIDVNFKKVKNAQKLLSIGEYKINTIILNVLKGTCKNEDEMLYKDNVLTVKTQWMDIISGLTDIIALSYVLEDNPDLNIDVNVEIKKYNLNDIKKYFNKISLKGGIN